MHNIKTEEVFKVINDAWNEVLSQPEKRRIYDRKRSKYYEEQRRKYYEEQRRKHEMERKLKPTFNVCSHD